MSRAGRILQRLAPVPDALFVWVPVLIALGIGGYFLWPGEPGRPAYAGAAALMLAGLGLMRRRSGLWRRPV
ncbi:MAG: hypothetical protein R3D84_14005 [Paracoccaceae bacterium]